MKLPDDHTDTQSESGDEEDHFSDASEGQQQHQTSGHYGFSPEQHSPRQSASPTDQLHQRRQSRDAPSVPITVVEKVDPFTPSYGEVPGTMAYDSRQADAVPDVVTSREDQGEQHPSRSESTADRPPVPITKVTKIDHSPDPAEVPGTHAYETHKQDAEPDVIEEQEDVPAPGKTLPS